MADLMQLLTQLGMGQPPQPEAPKSKRQVIGTAVGDFLTAIGAGLSNRGRSNQSTGAGAAMQMPQLLAQQRAQQMQAQQAQAQQQKQQQFQNLMAVVNQKAMHGREDRLSQPPGPQPFSLNPGQTRYGPDGKPLVSAPAATPVTPPAQPFSLNPGQTRFGPDGQPIANIPPVPPPPPAPQPGFSLSPGQTRFGPDGKPLASVPAAPQNSGGTDVAAVDNAAQYSAERADRTIQSVNELLPKVNNMTVGFGSLMSKWPTTAANNFRAELDTLKANIGFNELTAMRQASKTGGALGNVSDRELNLLTSALGALDQSQDVDSVKANLTKVKASVERWKAAVSSSAAPIVQQNKATGQWRHSIDGGKTWRSGKP